MGRDNLCSCMKPLTFPTVFSEGDDGSYFKRSSLNSFHYHLVIELQIYFLPGRLLLVQ